MTALPPPFPEPPPFPGFEQLPSTNGHRPGAGAPAWAKESVPPPTWAPPVHDRAAPVLFVDPDSPADPERARARDAAEDHDRSELFPYLGDRGWRPLLALMLLASASVAPFAVLLVHRPELRIDLELSAVALDRAAGLTLAAVVLAAFVAGLATRAVDAALLLRITAGLAGVVAIVGAGVADATWLGIIVFAVLLFTGPTLALGRAYAYDVYGAGGGWRVAAACWAGAALGVAVVSAWELFADRPNWGYQLAVVGTAALVGAVLLPSARRGPATAEDAPTAVHGERPPLAPFLALGLGIGLAVVAVSPVALDILLREWRVDRAQVGLAVALAGLGGALVCAMAHWYSRVARRDAAYLTGLAGAATLLTAVLMVVGAASDTLVGVIVSWAAAGTCAAFAAVTVEATLVSSGRPAVRHWTGATLLAGVALGGIAIAVMPTVTAEIGRVPAIALAVLPLALFGLLVMVRFPSSMQEPATVREPAAAETTEDPATTEDPGEQVAGLWDAAPALVGTTGSALLDCRGIDAGYDGVQVLFGVDLTVEEGEIVALMGTNGAGKTTLLRTVSGLLTPQRGSLTFGGVDLAGLGPTERVQLGMTQIAGGESLAPGLTVAENLTLFAHTLHHGKGSSGRISASIDDAFAQFPRLAERRNQAASTLSGGEKQMLALAKAFVLRPRLLVIDEFSLGLAPKIVGELLPVVSRLNQQGASILLVEQSVNVALSVARHAYFMEKGEIVFEGPADELRDQPELLRAVYLEGITAAVGA